MRLQHIVFSLFFLGSLAFREVDAEVLKTMNISMPTNFGTFFGEIHYSEKDLQLALMVERIIKEDLIKVVNYFEYVPHDIVHFNIDPYKRETNGNARTFPTNIINLYNFPANNSEHLIALENWLQGLVLHEFVHIVHLDQTRDYLLVGRQIFGTIAKIPVGVVPRWFSEGIAVWGESHLLNGGRLNHQLFNKELLLYFLKENSCQTIDCLDAPGGHPQGQLAYWAGAHFIEYLENAKPKTIKCLVEQNSLALPFFLNNAFEACVGEKAQDLFVKFRENYIAQRTKSSSWGEKIVNAFGSDDFQKGYVLEGERLFKVEKQKFSEALVAYDLKDEVNFHGQFEWPISDIVSMVDGGGENKWLLMAFSDDPNSRGHNKSWKLVNPDTLLVERTLDFTHDPSYVVSLGGEQFLTFSYWENRWQAENNGEIKRLFSSNDNIVLVKKVEDKILLKINDSYGMSSLVLTDVNLVKLEVLYRSAKFFELPVIGPRYVVIREQGEFKLIDWSRKPEMSNLSSAFFTPFTFIKQGEQRGVALEEGLKVFTNTSFDLEALIKQNKTASTPIAVNEFQEQKASPHSYTSDKAEGYPRLDHMIPHYWFLATGSSDNLGSIGALTTFSDPMDIYTLNATILAYPSASKVGGSIDYTQKLVAISDLWNVALFLNQDYSKTSFDPKINTSRDLNARTFYKVLNGRWTYIPSLQFGHSITDDFISRRTVSLVGFNNQVTYQALSFDDMFQYFNGEFNLLGNQSSRGASYMGTQVVTEAIGRFAKTFMGSFRGSYEKLFKSDFIRGVVYGGGIGDFSKKRVHEFYGLPYSNAYGNKIYTGRLMGDWEMTSVYRGKNLIPFYLKELHLLFGLESLYADRIILDNKVLREKAINGVFIGPRMKMNFFYFVPTNVDFIYSRIGENSKKIIQQLDFLLTADF